MDNDPGRKSSAITRSWEEIVLFFSFTASVRRVIYTTNAIENLNSCVQRAVATPGHPPSDKAVTKIISMARRHAERKRKAHPPVWHKALGEFAILFEGRFQVLPR